jgi:hypothetical protein
MIDEHRIAATAGATALDIIEGRVAFADTRAPWIDATLTVAGTDLGEDLDATQTRRVVITAEQRFADWAFSSDLSDVYGGMLTSDLTALYAGMLTSDLTALPSMAWNAEPIEATRMDLSLMLMSTTELPNGTTRLELASDEAALLEMRFLSFGAATNFGVSFEGDNTLRQAIEMMLSGDLQIEGFQPTTSLLPGDFDAALPIFQFENLEIDPWLPWKSGQSAWEAIQPALQLANARVMGRGDVGLELVDADYTESARLDISAGVNLIDYQARRDRTLDTYGDAVAIVYSEANGTYSASVAAPETGTWSKPILVEVDGRCPVNQFTAQEPDEPARRLLGRALRRAFAADAVAVSNYNTRPRFGVDLTAPDSLALVGVVQQVTFDLTSFEMSITLQEVEEAA